MASARPILVPAAALVLGLAVGVGVSRLRGRDADGLRSLSEQLAEQEQVLRRQAQAIDALSGAVNQLRSDRGGSPESSCVTAADLRAALDARGRGGPAPVESATAADARAAAEAASLGRDARDQATRLVDGATATGVWSDQNAAEFRSLLASMSPTQRDEALSALVGALNQHKLKAVGRRPF
jgi:hypothetical protein